MSKSSIILISLVAVTFTVFFIMSESSFEKAMIFGVALIIENLISIDDTLKKKK